MHGLAEDALEVFSLWPRFLTQLNPLLQGDETINILQAATEKKDEGKEGETFFHVVQASIPQEIIIEILSWLPVKSLLTRKCVCKQWHALIQDRYFIEKHMSRSTLHISYCLFRIIYLRGNHKLIHGRDGLSLERNYRTQNYCIRNRATYQRLDLPDPCEGSLSLTLSYIPSTSDYKLVSISLNYERWEVRTVGKDKSWRPFLSNLQGCNMKSQRATVVSAGLAVHCMRITEVCSKSAAEVVSFDLESETFTSIVLPHELFSDWKKVQALDWNGFLSFAEISQENLNVMVLEDYKKLKWDK
ncbi:unnamed protein product [Dovyalis caffra]|uniref:F-box domain-containing protein n=1 Tax=Dovyalis caffra TaxID=77055 RepID=A0AAV1SHG9_9ROSI|nr:unnamed protein product [Dovyalis caffra]